LIGARTRQQLSESLGALDVQLTPTDLAQIEAAVPQEAVSGTRYDVHGMQTLDSEKS
jgi:aryl-alcohol dehydrogenase-like predicted oxidoreductase